MVCRNLKKLCHFSLWNSQPSNCYSNIRNKTQCHFLYCQHNTGSDKSNPHFSPSLLPIPTKKTCRLSNICSSYFVLRDLVSTPQPNTSFYPFVTLHLISGYFNVQLDLSTAKIIPGNGNNPVLWLGSGTIDFTSLKDTGSMLFLPLYGFCNIENCTVADYAQTEILQGQRDTTHQSLPQSHWTETK